MEEEKSVHKNIMKGILRKGKIPLMTKRRKSVQEKDQSLTSVSNLRSFELPCLEIKIQHSGHSHSPHLISDDITYQYIAADGNVTEVNIEKEDFCSKSSENNSGDFIYEEHGNRMKIKRSTINSFRKINNYYGPLKIVQKVETENVAKNVATYLEPVDFAMTQNQDRSVSDQELNNLFNQTPGIIPSCSPPTKKRNEEEFTIIRKENKKYKISKAAFNFFKEKTGCDNKVEFKVEEIFQTSNEKVNPTPITKIVLYEKKKKCSSKISLLPKRKKRLQRNKRIINNRKNEKMKHFYSTNHVNWSRRGNRYFTDINRVGIKFIDELFIEWPVQDNLKELGESLSTTAGDLQDLVKEDDSNIGESIDVESTNEHPYDIWSVLLEKVRQKSYLISFEYEMDNEKWVEIKRSFNVLQVNGESLPDIQIKIVLRDSGPSFVITYYLRCLNHLIKQGFITSMIEINFLIKIFDRNKYACIGIDKEKYIYQCDENELLRQHLKENGQISVFPFESIRDKKCKRIVTDSEDVGNYKFRRANFTIFGPVIICKPCDYLLDKLEELLDPSLNVSTFKQDSHKFTKQRYGPIQSIFISQNIKKLCLETPFEFISDSCKLNSSTQKNSSEESLPKKRLKCFDFDTDLCEDERSNIRVSEKEFENMLTIKNNADPNGKLSKTCNKCGFKAPSMLSIFLHMSCHIGNATEECNMKILNSESSVQHSEKNYMCTICEKSFISKEELFVHMNCHRSHPPYDCVYCDQRQQSFEEYMKHMKLSHCMDTMEQMNFCCNICSTNFFTYDYLIIHRLNSGHSDKNQFKCKICKFSCSLIPSFKTHLLTHTLSQREFHNLAMCQVCKMFFFSTFEMEDHLKEDHKNIVNDHKDLFLQEEQQINSIKGSKSAKIFTCEKCFNVYGTKNALQYHLEIEHTDKIADDSLQYSFLCNHCGMKFASDYFLNVHMSVHSSTNSPAFQNGELGYRTVYNKRHNPLDQISTCIDGNMKPLEKHPVLVQQHQQPHINPGAYNHSFPQTQQLQINFADGTLSAPSSQPIVIRTPSNTDWNQPMSSLEDAHDSVYSLLHL